MDRRMCLRLLVFCVLILFSNLAAWAQNYAGTWWDEKKSGQGITVLHGGDTVAGAWYLYDEDGKGMWLTFAGQLVGNTANVSLQRYTGPKLGTTFDPAQVTPVTIGNANLLFTSATAAQFNYTVNGFSGSLNLQPFTLANGTAGEFSGAWWDASQSGQGITLLNEGDTVAGVWYLYDDAGKGMWANFSGQLLGNIITNAELRRYQGPPLGIPFDPAQVTFDVIGSVGLAFTSADSAVFNFVVNDTPGVLKLSSFQIQSPTCTDVPSSWVTAETMHLTCSELFLTMNGYKVQMHLHGHSNHNGSGKPGSMQWHQTQALLSDTADVLWWTDHDGMFDLTNKEFNIDLSQGSLAPETFAVTGMGTGRSEVTWMEPTISQSALPWTSHGPQGIEFGIQSAGDPLWQQFEYLLRNETPDGKVKSTAFARPISSGARLAWEMVTTGLSADVQAEIELKLAYHYNIPTLEERQHSVILRPDPNITEVIASPVGAKTVLIRIPLTLDGQYDVGMAPYMTLIEDGHGDDNTISEIILRVKARNSASGSMRIRDLSITSDHPEPLHQLAKVQEFAARYEAEFGLTNYVGLEHGNELPHFNSFFPDPLADDELLFGPLPHEQWITGVHARDGLVSLNHPFGTNSGFINLLSEAEQQQVLEAALPELLATSAHGADILEVGYIARGGAHLPMHLKLWDILTANEIYLMGNGSSDSHGGLWHEYMLPGNFTTWLYAPTPQRDDLLDALQKGRAVFGNPWLWDGLFYHSVGDHVMGTRTTSTAGLQPLSVVLQPWPADLEVNLVQGLIKPGVSSVSYLHEGTLVTPSSAIMLDVSQSCFVRLEVYQRLPNSSRKPVVFTNPIVFSTL